MVNVDEAFEVHYKQGKEDFQILVDFEKLEEFRKDPNKYSVYDILADYKIYKDVKKGEIASEKAISEIFGMKDEEEVLKTILLKGEAQIPSSYLNKLRDEKKEQVIYFIKENARNPITHTPYTESMIRAEVEKLKYNFDIKRDYKQQAEEILEFLKQRMPISIGYVIAKLEIPSKYIGKVVSQIRRYGKIKKEYYDNYANWHVHLKIIEGKREDLINFLNKNTNKEAGYSFEKE